jgi:hypothetical protein
MGRVSGLNVIEAIQIVMTYNSAFMKAVDVVQL